MNHVDGRRLATNTVWNLIGQGAPLIVALVAVPILIRALGTDRFGVLMLAWAVIGYFGLFDLGLGRALTQAAGAALGAGDVEGLSLVSVAALAAMFGLGLAACIAMCASTPWLVHVLKVPPKLHHETTLAFYMLGTSLPFVVMGTGLRGLLEAHQDFSIATALRLPYAAFNYVGPLLVLPFSVSLVPVVGILIVGRLLTWLAHLIVCLRRYPYLRRGRLTGLRALVPLLRIGGWMTVSNLVSPLMYNIDRFFIGALLSMSAVAYYVTPFELGTKLLLIPTAILGVLFPAFATTYTSDRARTTALLERAVRLMSIVMFVPVLLLAAFAPEVLRLWVGSDMARQGAAVLRWLALGIFANSVAQIPFAALQAVGRPDITAKLHLIELPLYGVALWWLTRTLGVQGVAIAWTMRMSLDCLALCVLAARKIPSAAAAIAAPLPLFLGLGALAMLPTAVPALAPRTATTLVLLAAFAAFAWLRALHGHEREFLLGFVRLPRRREVGAA